MSACQDEKPHSTRTYSIVRGAGGSTAANGIATGKSKTGLGSAIFINDVVHYRKYAVATLRTMCACTTISTQVSLLVMPQVCGINSISQMCEMKTNIK
jgi:hypothetical protein